MRIQNHTLVPTAALQGIIRFVEGLLPVAAAARFVFHPQSEGRTYMTGLATFEGAVAVGTLPFPVTVEVWITDRDLRSWPRLDQYVPTLPAILLRGWEEELFLVMAHEMRHVHQFLTGEKDSASEGDPVSEHDAEQFAYQALFNWRQRGARRCRVVSKLAA